MRYKYSFLDTIYNVHLVKAKYANGRIALELYEEGELAFTVTCNLPEYDIGPDEIIVKTWSENEDMLDFLVRNNIVMDTGRDVPTGHVNARVCKLLV